MCLQCSFSGHHLRECTHHMISMFHQFEEFELERYMSRQYSFSGNHQRRYTPHMLNMFHQFTKSVWKQCMYLQYKFFKYHLHGYILHKSNKYHQLLRFESWHHNLVLYILFNQRLESKSLGKQSICLRFPKFNLTHMCLQCISQ
jgi:hypothetical protein